MSLKKFFGYCLRSLLLGALAFGLCGAAAAQTPRRPPASPGIKIPPAGRYVLRLDGFQIHRTMSVHRDTDFVYFTIKVGKNKPVQIHKKIGDLNDGTYKLGWELGPVPAVGNTPVLMTYQIINHGHARDEKRLKDSLVIANKIASTVGKMVGAAFPGARELVGLIGQGLRKLGEVLTWLVGQVNCDGVVLSDAVSVSGAELARRTESRSVWTETRRYTGPDTPIGCGRNARYSVTWSIRRAP